MRKLQERYIILLALIPLGWWLFLQTSSSWRNYWILNDGRQGMAIITKEDWGGHDRFDYRYSVESKEFTGVSDKDWKDEKYKNAPIGGQAIVYYSASHPWLSKLHRPDSFINLLPASIALGASFWILYGII
jgi:hypothetical protein